MTDAWWLAPATLAQLEQRARALIDADECQRAVLLTAHGLAKLHGLPARARTAMMADGLTLSRRGGRELTRRWLEQLIGTTPPAPQAAPGAGDPAGALRSLRNPGRVVAE